MRSLGLRVFASELLNVRGYSPTAKNEAAAAEPARRHSSCRANHGNDCFKMWRSSGTVEVISFHCQQNRSLSEGKQAPGLALPAGPGDLTQAGRGCRSESEATGVKARRAERGGHGKPETIRRMQIKEGELGAEPRTEARPQKRRGAIAVHREPAAAGREKLQSWLLCGE